MARRKRQSTAEDIMDAVALLPWWAGVALAFASYLFFHWLAGRPQPTISGPGQVGSLFPYMFITGVSGALQYLAPMLCLVGALISFVKRTKRASLVANVTASKGADALNDMSWAEFETLTAEAFRLQGFAVQEQGGAQPDGGVDLVARKGSETFLVQCKQWRAFKVGVDVVRELYGVMAARGAAGGYVVTSGTFTADARTFAEGRNVRLIDGTRLFGLLQQARASLDARGAAPAAPLASTPAKVVPPSNSAPSCPMCKATMVRRTAKKGANCWGAVLGMLRVPGMSRDALMRIALLAAGSIELQWLSGLNRAMTRSFRKWHPPRESVCPPKVDWPS
jgi:restriction system protein